MPSDPLDLTERIAKIDAKIEAIQKRRLPHAHMERGKALKRGDTVAAGGWQTEIARLNDLLVLEGKLRAEACQELYSQGFKAECNHE